MTLATKLILIAALVLSIFIPFGYYLLGEKNKGRYKCALAFNVLSYFGTFLVAGIMLFGSVPVHAGRCRCLRRRPCNRSWLHCSSSCYRSFLHRWRYCRSKCSKRSSWSYQRGFPVLGKSLIFVGHCRRCMPVRSYHLLHDLR